MILAPSDNFVLDRQCIFEGVGELAADGLDGGLEAKAEKLGGAPAAEGADVQIIGHIGEQGWTRTLQTYRKLTRVLSATRRLVSSHKINLRSTFLLFTFVTSQNGGSEGVRRSTRQRIRRLHPADVRPGPVDSLPLKTTPVSVCSCQDVR